jgi:Rps23 Pro-64 3,4-dihydroxylase Tpa1-like proline 4-hydroxylase
MERKELVSLILEKLEINRDLILQQWQSPQGTRTRHFVLDDLLPVAIAHQIYDAFPKTGDGFHDRESFREKKRTSKHLSQYAPILGEITYAFQDPAIVASISKIIGFDHLEPDPSLYAGGLSMMFKGDFLNPHIDNSHDAQRAHYRRLNLLFYVTPEWKVENGGNFELWDDERRNPKTLVSKFNRLIVMETNKISWHSVSPVKAAGARCCVSNYYFSKISPDETEYFHVTSFDGRPDEKVKRAIGVFDNALRNVVSKTLKTGRGKEQINEDVPKKEPGATN